MSYFIQVHMLTSYPPSNLNRDRLGNQKTAFMGGCFRLRISSQCLKRSWRSSALFREALKGHVGVRTQRIGIDIYKKFIDKKVSPKNAREWTKKIISQFGKLKYDKKPTKGDEKSEQEHVNNLEKFLDLQNSEMYFFDPNELQAIDNLINHCIGADREPSEEELKKLFKITRACDIACFGRMLASHPEFNTDAAIQVSNSITTHAADSELDAFTAVDDLNMGTGSAFLGDKLFGAGVYYTYININRDLLLNNLGDDEELTNKTIAALLECATKVSPKGMQNTYASNTYANYILIEMGYCQPRSLDVAFLTPISYENILENSIEALESYHQKIENSYGSDNKLFYILNIPHQKGNFQEMIKYIQETNRS